MTRSVKEWIGKTDDSVPPLRVRMRVFHEHNKTCHISGRKIRGGEAWELDHIVALCNGGENRESNLAPALVQPHKEKTARDVAEKAKIDRIRAKHFGQHKPKSRLSSSKYSKKFNGTVIDRKTGLPAGS